MSSDCCLIMYEVRQRRGSTKRYAQTLVKVSLISSPLLLLNYFSSSSSGSPHWHRHTTHILTQTYTLTHTLTTHTNTHTHTTYSNTLRHTLCRTPTRVCPVVSRPTKSASSFNFFNFIKLLSFFVLTDFSCSTHLTPPLHFSRSGIQVPCTQGHHITQKSSYTSS